MYEQWIDYIGVVHINGYSQYAQLNQVLSENELEVLVFEKNDENNWIQRKKQVNSVDFLGILLDKPERKVYLQNSGQFSYNEPVYAVVDIVDEKRIRGYISLDSFLYDLDDSVMDFLLVGDVKIIDTTFSTMTVINSGNSEILITHSSIGGKFFMNVSAYDDVVFADCSIGEFVEIIGELSVDTRTAFFNEKIEHFKEVAYLPF